MYKKSAPKAGAGDSKGKKVDGKGKGKEKVVEEDEPMEDEDNWGPTEDEEEVMRAMEIEMMEEQEDDETKRRRMRDKNLPAGITSVLEEQPKWALLADVLAEIEEELFWAPIDTREPNFSVHLLLVPERLIGNMP